MQTTTTLDQAADQIQAEFPGARVHVAGDHGIEVYIGQPEDACFIEQVTDDETGEVTGWDAREGWGDATYPGTIHISESGIDCDTLDDAVSWAIDYLPTPEH